MQILIGILKYFVLLNFKVSKEVQSYTNVYVHKNAARVRRTESFVIQ